VIQEDVDRRLAEYAAREIPKLPRPFFLVLHFFGTHAPYYFDEGHATFQPWDRTVAWSRMDKLRNAYKNAILEQDRSIAAALRAFQAATRGGPNAVVFTSDHGESFGEHGAIHHGQNLYDEQIHVPAWMVHHGGALSTDEAARLAANEKAWLTHLDVLPTILDLYGAWDSWAYAPYRARLAGRSLLAPAGPMSRPVPITNCTEMFPCPVNTWGVLFEDRALEAQRWDGDWRCLDLRAESELDPRDPFCQRLRDASKASFPELPNRRPNL
jgi:arylsulfatase A-like enzyme